MKTAYTTLFSHRQEVRGFCSTGNVCVQRKSIAFSIVTVTVIAAKKQFNTLAVLDQCIDAMVCTASFLNKPNIQVRKTLLEVDR